MARPREFEPDEALEKAMQQFWAKGFHDTSIRDLIGRTGVNQYGLYGVFENKRGLYLAALDHYRDTVTREALRRLEGPGPIAERFEALFEWLLARMRTADGPVGCLMCNAAVEMAPEDVEAAEKFQAHRDHLCAAFRTRLAEARSSGDLSADTDIDALAEFLTATAYSLGFLLRAGCSQDYLRRHVRTALSVLR